MSMCLLLVSISNALLIRQTQFDFDVGNGIITVNLWLPSSRL